MSTPIPSELQTIDNTVLSCKGPKFKAPFWKRVLLRVLYWIVLLVALIFSIPLLFIPALFFGIRLFWILPIWLFLVPTFCYGIVMYVSYVTKYWIKYNKFPGFQCGLPSAIIVWTVGGVTAIIQNWFFVWQFNKQPDFAIFTILIPYLSIFIGIFLSSRVEKKGRISTIVQKTSTMIKCHKTFCILVVVGIILSSIIGQQVYYKMTTRLPFLDRDGISHQVYWNYFAFFNTIYIYPLDSPCPFDKFPKLEQVVIPRFRPFDFNRISNMSSLKEIIFLGNAKVTQSDMKRLASYPHLETLKLRCWNTLDKSNSTGLEYLARLQHLTQLSLDVTFKNIDDISCLKDIPHLESLTFNYLVDCDWGGVDFVALKSAPTLKDVHLIFPFCADKNEVEYARKTLSNCKITVEENSKNKDINFEETVCHRMTNM